jgi:hypothetical protein
VIFGRGRFHDLVERQLDLFEAETDLLAEAAEADAAWTNSGVGEAAELYGDYQLVVDAIGESLLDIRETYASTLGEDAADGYRGSFDRAARKRYGRLAALLDDD